MQFLLHCTETQNFIHYVNLTRLKTLALDDIHMYTASAISKFEKNSEFI